MAFRALFQGFRKGSSVSDRRYAQATGPPQDVLRPKSPMVFCRRRPDFRIGRGLRPIPIRGASGRLFGPLIRPVLDLRIGPREIGPRESVSSQTFGKQITLDRRAHGSRTEGVEMGKGGVRSGRRSIEGRRENRRSEL
jgi:hypothetical protein